MIGIDIITAPDGATSGTYRCNCCGVMLTSEENLKIHLETSAHQMFIEGRKKAIKQIKIEKDCCWLIAHNDKYPPIKVTEENEFQIFGVVANIIKSVY